MFGCIKSSERASNEALPRSDFRTLALQKGEQFTFAMLHLIHRTLARSFVGTPSQKIRAVPEPATGKMVIRNFDDHSWSDWFPFAGAVRAPTAGSSGRVASEARWFSKRFKSFRQVAALFSGESRGESDVMKQAIVPIKAEQQ